MHGSNEKWTDTMQVCRNGHLINHSYINKPENNQDYCKKCGKETIIKCPACEQEIPGKTHAPGRVRLFRGSVPNYCQYCNEAYPWHKGIVKWKKRIGSSLPYIPKSVDWIFDKISKLMPTGKG